MEQLRVARGVLAPSYVFAYFLFGNDMYKVRQAHQDCASCAVYFVYFVM